MSARPSKPRAGPAPRPDAAARALSTPVWVATIGAALGVVSLASVRWTTTAELILHGGLLSTVFVAAALVRRRRAFGLDGGIARSGAVCLSVGCALAIVRLLGVETFGWVVPVEISSKTFGVALVGFLLGRRMFGGDGGRFGAKLRSTFDSISDPIVVIDEGCRVTEVNWIAELRFETSIVGVLACESPYFTRDACVGCPVAQCFDERAARFFTVRDDDRRPRSEISMMPVPRDDGVIEAVVQHVTDVSARSVVEERMRFLGDVVAAIDDGVIGIDPRGIITAINPAACGLVGVEENGAVGDAILPRLPFADPAMRRRVEEALEHGTAARLDVRLTRGDGPPRQVVLSIDPIEGDLGEGIGAAVRLRDVTESRQVAARLRQSERLSSLGTFVSGLAHELNSPITAVCAVAERLDADAVVGAESVAEIQRQSDRCRRVVAGLLRFARCARPERRVEDLRALLTRVVDLLARVLERDGIMLVETLPDAPVLASVDGAQLEQVILNLVTNARDALVGGGVGGRIWLRTVAAGDEAVIEVADDGPGIPAGDHDRVFEAFHTTKGVGEGTGLGLALSRGLVQDHGGSLEMGARDPQGTVFRVRLPLEERRAEAMAPIASASSARLGVLVVDDEPGIAEFMKFCVESGGHDVVIADSVGQAQSSVRSRAAPFDVVVSDVSLGDGSGLDLYDFCLGHSGAYRGRFVFVTADSFIDEEELTADGNRLVRKPFARDELLRSLVVATPAS